MVDPSEVLNKFINDIESNQHNPLELYKVIKGFCDEYDLTEGTFGVIDKGITAAMEGDNSVSKEEILGVLSSAGSYQYSFNSGVLPLTDYDMNEAKELLDALGVKTYSPLGNASSEEIQKANEFNKNVMEQKIGIAELSHIVNYKP